MTTTITTDPGTLFCPSQVLYTCAQAHNKPIHIHTIKIIIKNLKTKYQSQWGEVYEREKCVLLDLPQTSVWAVCRPAGCAPPEFISFSSPWGEDSTVEEAVVGMAILLGSPMIDHEL